MDLLADVIELYAIFARHEPNPRDINSLLSSCVSAICTRIKRLTYDVDSDVEGDAMTAMARFGRWNANTTSLMSDAWTTPKQDGYVIDQRRPETEEKGEHPL